MKPLHDVGSKSIVGSYVPMREMSVDDIWNKSYMNCGNEMKWRRSFLHFISFPQFILWFISFHFRCSYMIYFIYIINTHFSHRNIWTHNNWPAPNISGFIAQLVEHRTGIATSRVQTPLKSWIFFQASSCNCINCIHCDDHFFLSFHFRSSYMIYWAIFKK